MQKNISSHTFLFAKDYRTMAWGWTGAPYNQEIRPGAVFITRDFVREKLGGG